MITMARCIVSSPFAPRTYALHVDDDEREHILTGLRAMRGEWERVRDESPFGPVQNIATRKAAEIANIIQALTDPPPRTFP